MTEKDHRLGAKWSKSRKVFHAVDNTWHWHVLGKVTHEAMYRETFKIWSKDSLLRKCLRPMDWHSGSEGYPLGKSCLEATQKDSWCGDEMVKDVSWHFLHLTNCSTSQIHKYVFSLNVFLYQRGHHLDTYYSPSVGLVRSHVSIWMPQVWESGELGYSVHSCHPQKGTQVTLEGEDGHLSNSDSNCYISLLNSHIGIMSIIFYELLIDSLSVTYAWSDFYLHSRVDYKSLLFSLHKWEKGKTGSKTLEYVLRIPSIPKSACKLLSYMKTQICKNL